MSIVFFAEGFLAEDHDPGDANRQQALIGHTGTEQRRDYQNVSFDDLRAITDLL